jgi:hypothetical protein
MPQPVPYQQPGNTVGLGAYGGVGNSQQLPHQQWQYQSQWWVCTLKLSMPTSLTGCALPLLRQRCPALLTHFLHSALFWIWFICILALGAPALAFAPSQNGNSAP